MHHSLPCIASYINLCCFSVLPTLPCFASCIDLLCIICRLVLHHTWLSILSYSCVLCLPYWLLLLVSACSVAIVRIRSSTRDSSSRLLFRLLHVSILLPCGISGKMTITLDTFTIIAMLSCLDAIVTCRATHLLCQPLLVSMKPLTFETFLAKPLFGYVTRLLSPSYSIVSCR